MAKSRRHARSKARAAAVALLYSSDITEQDVDRIVEGGQYPADDLELSDYAEMLVEGVAAHAQEIDGRIAKVSENWTLERMPVVDRAILRMSTYEMLYVKDVPISVSINEAVELAKAYGGEDDSSRFVNGVLGRIARQIEGVPESKKPAPAPREAVQGEGADATPEGDAAQQPSDAPVDSPAERQPETAEEAAETADA